MNPNNIELKTFGVLILLLFIWFGIALPYLTPEINNNFMLAYTIFIIVDTYLSSKYILFPNEKVGGRRFLALLLIFLGTDIIMFPYLVSQNGLVTNDAGAIMSSDVYIWSMIPSSVAPIIKYYLVYVFAVALMFMIARGLTTRKWFWQHVKQV